MSNEDVVMDAIIKTGGLRINEVNNSIEPTDLKSIFEKPTEAWEAFDEAVGKYCNVIDELGYAVGEEDNRKLTMYKCDYKGNKFYLVSYGASGFDTGALRVSMYRTKLGAIRGWNSEIDDAVMEINDILNSAALPENVEEELESTKRELESHKYSLKEVEQLP